MERYGKKSSYDTVAIRVPVPIPPILRLLSYPPPEEKNKYTMTFCTKPAYKQYSTHVKTLTSGYAHFLAHRTRCVVRRKEVRHARDKMGLSVHDEKTPLLKTPATPEKPTSGNAARAGKIVAVVSLGALFLHLNT